MENYPNPSAEEAAKSLAEKEAAARELAASGQKEAHESTGVLPDAAADDPNRLGGQTAQSVAQLDEKAAAIAARATDPADDLTVRGVDQPAKTGAAAEVRHLEMRATEKMAEAKNEVESIRGRVAEKFGEVRGMSAELALDAKNKVASVADHAADEVSELREKALKKAAEAKTKIDALHDRATDDLDDLREDANEKLAEARVKAREIAAKAAAELDELEAEAREKVAEAKEKAAEIAAHAMAEFEDIREDAAEAMQAASSKAKGFWAKLFGK